MTFLTLTEDVGPSASFWMCALLTAFAVIFAYKLVPETKGRTLEEIEAFWDRSPKLITVASATKDSPDRAA